MKARKKKRVHTDEVLTADAIDGVIVRVAFDRHVLEPSRLVLHARCINQ